MVWYYWSRWVAIILGKMETIDGGGRLGGQRSRWGAKGDTTNCYGAAMKYVRKTGEWQRLARG